MAVADCWRAFVCCLGGAPTPDGGFRLGSFWIELEVVAPTFTPIVEIKLKPLYFIQSFYTDNENDDDIKKDLDLLALRNWVSAIKASELYPVIKDGSLPIYIEGHASKQGAISWTSTCRRSGDRMCRNASKA